MAHGGKGTGILISDGWRFERSCCSRFQALHESTTTVHVHNYSGILYWRANFIRVGNQINITARFWRGDQSESQSELFVRHREDTISAN